MCVQGPHGKMLNRPKKVNAVSTKTTEVIFSPSLPFALFVFALWFLNTFSIHVMHVLNMLWIPLNMSLGMLCAFWNIHNKERLWVQNVPRYHSFFLENMNGAKGKLKKHFATILLYWLHLLSLADWTIFPFLSTNLYLNLYKSLQLLAHVSF